MFIGIRKTRNTDDSLGSGTKLLLPSLSLGFRHEERERERETHTHTQFFYADCSSIVSSQLTDPTKARAHTPQSTNCNGLAQDRKINSLRLSLNLNSLLFFKITQNPSTSFPGMTSFTSPEPFPICFFFLLWHLWLSHPPRALVNTCINVCTYPCTKPKGS